MYVVDGPLPRPGVTRVPGGAPDGPEVEVEVWSLPEASLGGFLRTVAPPLGIGPVELADGSTMLGFICSADGVDADRDITDFGGWLAWRSTLVSPVE